MIERMSLKPVAPFNLLIDVFLHRDEGADFAADKCVPRRSAGLTWDEFVVQLRSSESGE